MRIKLISGVFSEIFMAIHFKSGLIRVSKTINLRKQKISTRMLKRKVSILKIMVFNYFSTLFLLKKKHPNITETIDYFQSGAKFHLISEYYSGGSLIERIINNKRFNE